MMLVRVGERLYEFDTVAEVNKAREIYSRFTGDQNSFEDYMENNHIDLHVFEDY